MNCSRLLGITLAPCFLILPAFTQRSTSRPPLEVPQGSQLTTPTAQSGGLDVLAELGPQNSFWSNMLTSDADHDGLREFVLNVDPKDGSASRVEFFEEDGSGGFRSVHQIPLTDGGPLAVGDIDGDGLTDLFVERAIGTCNHRYLRFEAASPDGFPSVLVWSGKKDGDVTDFQAVIADSDQDGTLEFITSDNGLGCARSSLKVFRPGANDQMDLIASLPLEGAIGNPVVADLDLDGTMEIAVAEAANGALLLFDVPPSGIPERTVAWKHGLINAYQIAAVDRFSPTDRPLLFLAGQRGALGYRLQSYEAPTDGALSRIAEVNVPSGCGASIAQLAAGDLFGSPTPELALDRLCDTVPIFRIVPRGIPQLVLETDVPSSLELVVLPRAAQSPPAIAIGTLPNQGNPEGSTLVLGRAPKTSLGYGSQTRATADMTSR